MYRYKLEKSYLTIYTTYELNWFQKFLYRFQGFAITKLR